MTRTDWSLVLLIAVLAALVRLYALGEASLWLDETATIRFAQLPLSTLWVSAYDPNPPIYYTLIKLLLPAGHSEAWVRLPSVVFGVLSIVVMYLATRKLGGTVAAVTTALVLSLSFHQIEYSQEARAYALLGFCLALSFLGLVNLAQRWQDAARDSSPRAFLLSGGGLYALGVLAALYTHNAAVFYWLGVQFFFLAWWWRALNLSRVGLAMWFVVNAVVLLLWIPWLLASLSIMESGWFSWLSQYSVSGAWREFRSVHGFRGASEAQPWADICLALLALIGLYSLRQRVPTAVLLLSLVLLSSVGMWAYGLVSTPVYMRRSILWGSLFSAALVGMGVSLLRGYFRHVVIALIAVCGVVSTYRYFETDYAQNYDYRSAAAFIRQNSGPRDHILFRPQFVSYPFLYYTKAYPRAWRVSTWNCKNVPRAQGEKLRHNELGLTSFKQKGGIVDPRGIVPAAGDANLWVIQGHCATKRPTAVLPPLFAHWVHVDTIAFQGILLYRLVPRTPSR